MARDWRDVKADAASILGRPDWDTYYLDGARWVSSRADCRRRKVGAILVAADHCVLAVGYNGTDPGQPGCLSGACPRGLMSVKEQPPYGDYGNCIARHAEHNALLNVPGGPDLVWEADPTMYVTDQPCDGCMVLMRSAGVMRAAWPGGSATL